MANFSRLGYTLKFYIFTCQTTPQNYYRYILYIHINIKGMFRILNTAIFRDWMNISDLFIKLTNYESTRCKNILYLQAEIVQTCICTFISIAKYNYI